MAGRILIGVDVGAGGQCLYAAPDARARRAARGRLETAYYRVDESADQRGTELASALTNAHAIAIGLCDGLVKAGRAGTMYNTKSLLFTQALVEMPG
jgi:glycerol-3-phosphate dehydrogenase